MGVRTKTALETLQGLFTRRWYCGVSGSGYHNGCTCRPSEPHDGWGCGYQCIAEHLPDNDRTRALLDLEDD